MDILRAKEIIEGLADGVNPLIGEILPPTTRGLLQSGRCSSSMKRCGSI